MKPSHHHHDEEMNLDKELLSFEAELQLLRPSAVRFEMASTNPSEGTSTDGLMTVSSSKTHWTFAWGCVAGMAAGVAVTLVATKLLTTPVGPILPNEGPVVAGSGQGIPSIDSNKVTQRSIDPSSPGLEKMIASDTERETLTKTPLIWAWISNWTTMDSNKSISIDAPRRLHIVRARLDGNNLRDQMWLNEWIEPWASKVSSSAYRNSETSNDSPSSGQSGDASSELPLNTSEPSNFSSRSPSTPPELQTPETRPGQHQLMRSWLNESERFSG